MIREFGGADKRSHIFYVIVLSLLSFCMIREFGSADSEVICVYLTGYFVYCIVQYLHICLLGLWLIPYFSLFQMKPWSLIVMSSERTVAGLLCTSENMEDIVLL